MPAIAARQAHCPEGARVVTPETQVLWHVVNEGLPDPGTAYSGCYRLEWRWPEAVAPPWPVPGHPRDMGGPKPERAGGWRARGGLATAIGAAEIYGPFACLSATKNEPLERGVPTPGGDRWDGSEWVPPWLRCRIKVGVAKRSWQLSRISGPEHWLIWLGLYCLRAK